MAWLANPGAALSIVGHNFQPLRDKPAYASTRQPAAAAAGGLSSCLTPLFSFSECRRAKRHTTLVRLVDPPRRTVRDNLDGDIFGFRGSFVYRVMYVSAAQIREALACSEGFDRAAGVVDRERSLYHCDQTRARMGVPPGLSPGLEGVLSDIEVRVTSHLRVEKPIRQIASTHQVERAGWEVAHRNRV